MHRQKTWKRIIQRDFLNFVHRYRFTSVSNQIQPSELYDRWRTSLRLDRLFDDVKGELDAAIQFNNGEDQLSIANRSNELAQAGTRLAGVAALLGSVGLGLTLLQVGKIFDWVSARLGEGDAAVQGMPKSLVPTAIIVLSTLFVAILLGYGVVCALFPRDDTDDRSVRKVFHWPLAACFAAAAMLLLRLGQVL